MNSTSFSVTKLLKAFAEAKRIAPACADLPPPETVQTISCFPILPRNWKGNNNCSLRKKKKEKSKEKLKIHVHKVPSNAHFLSLYIQKQS